MKKSVLLFCALLGAALSGRAATTPAVIDIHTAHTQLVLAVDAAGNLRTRHYGARIDDPKQFLGLQKLPAQVNGEGPMTVPTTGGTFLGAPALHVRYADGNHNTELYYQSHGTQRKDGVTTTEVRLRDPVTSLAVTLVYDAYEKEDVIVAHTEITNGGKKPVQLLDYASSTMHFEADKYLLTHTWGGWASEMQVDRELLGHDTKVIESRRGVQVTQSSNPSFLLSLNTGEFSETAGEVVAGALAWSGNFRLAFDREGTWSQKYNMVWDKLWGLNLFPNDAMQREVAYYLKKQNRYGLPLDCRRTYTKSDWIMWTAAMSPDTKTFLKFMEPVYRYINETSSRVPTSDWHETTDGRMVGFRARSVIGGYWMKVLADKLGE